MWFPKTREKKRKIVYHYGPTNSGKTYHALEALKKAKNGVYCGMYIKYKKARKYICDNVLCIVSSITIISMGNI